jgi:hypothetical protein
MNKALSREFSENDIRFLIETVDPRLMARMGEIRTNRNLVEKMLDQHHERLLDRIVSLGEKEMLIKISPRLLFEILLRNTAKVLHREGYMLEKVGRQMIPIFEAMKVSEFLSKRAVLLYLADMLSSFTKIESFTLHARVKGGVWRKFRFNEMDIDSLIGLSEVVDEAFRFALYKRIGDACLFLLGVFPEYVTAQYQYPLSGHIRPGVGLNRPRAPEAYEKDGRKFYRLAAETPAAHEMDLEEPLSELAENFHLAMRPLNFMTDLYFRFKKGRLFDARA